MRLHKLVRDLEWALDAPLLFGEQSPKATCALQKLRSASDEWLDALDLDPTALERSMQVTILFMSESMSTFKVLEGKVPWMTTLHLQPSVTGKVQGYYTALLEFWLRCAPDGANRQIFSRLGVGRKRLATELRLLTRFEDTVCLHVEPSVMFAVAPSLDEGSPPGQMVGVDLDCNLLHRNRLQPHSCSC